MCPYYAKKNYSSNRKSVSHLRMICFTEPKNSFTYWPVHMIVEHRTKKAFPYSPLSKRMADWKEDAWAHIQLWDRLGAQLHAKIFRSRKST